MADGWGDLAFCCNAGRETGDERRRDAALVNPHLVLAQWRVGRVLLAGDYLIEITTGVRLHRADVEPVRAEFGHQVEIRFGIGDVTARQDEKPFAETDADPVIRKCFLQVTDKAGIVAQGPVRIAR